MKCKDCPHLTYCAQDYQIDLYCTGYFASSCWEDRFMDEPFDTIGEFLDTEAWKNCSDALKKTMDRIDPIHKIN